MAAKGKGAVAKQSELKELRSQFLSKFNELVSPSHR